jgi:hypothetical protein
MKTLYLGNRADDIREYQDHDVVLLAPSAKAVGYVELKKTKDAYLGHAWDGLDHKQKYFYYREMTQYGKVGSGEYFATPEAALEAARNWMNRENRNRKDIVLEVEAKDIDAKVAELFYFVQPKVDYPEREVPLDPRFVGLWLGDGTATCTEVTTIDQEIKDYVQQMATKYGCRVTISKKSTPGYCIVREIGASDNPVRSALHKLDILNNKHIPDIYMKNSAAVRIQLLAGLIDTDGTIQDNVYDFTQKSERLAKDALSLARSLGIYATDVERLARATNSPGCAYNVYQRVYMHMTRRCPDIPVLLKYKHWDREERGDSSLGIRISLEKTQESFRHEWTDALKDKLRKLVPKYTSKFGQIQWAEMQKSERIFTDFTPDALRTMYRELEPTQASGSGSASAIDNIKEEFINIVGKYYTEAGKIKWKDVMELDAFKSMTIQNMRTVMTKLTPDEEKKIAASKEEFEESVRARLKAVVIKYKNGKGGVAWETMVQDEPLFQHVGITQIKHMYKKMSSDVQGEMGDEQAKRADMESRLRNLISDPRYLLSTGKIKWKLLADAEFDGVNPDVLRVMYKKIKN